jgi:hypothetical protein
MHRIGLMDRGLLRGRLRFAAGVVFGCLLLLLFGAGAGGWSAQAASWSLQEFPNPRVSGGIPRGVSCLSATSCYAVGRYDAGLGEARPFVEAWNGTSWSLQESPIAGNTGLDAVSCSSESACAAVGTFNGTTLVERLTGGRWATQRLPVLRSPTLRAVACVSETLCIAVGRVAEGALALRWNGREWVTQTVPDPTEIFAEANAWDLTAISCTSSTNCIAVGSYERGEIFTTFPLAEHWDGTAWSVVEAPAHILSGLSCTSLTFCAGVGSIESGGVHRTVADHWDGESWTTKTTTNPSRTWNVLNGVSCTSSTFCMAVGWDIEAGGRFLTLVQEWAGTRWETVTTPNRGQINELNGVSCVSRPYCAAVGFYRPRAEEAALSLAERYS